MSGMGVLLCMCDRAAIEFLLHTQWSNSGSTSRSIHSKRGQAAFPPHPFSSKETYPRRLVHKITNVPVVYIGLDVWIWMGGNPGI
jgi:hypothetical protein